MTAIAAITALVVAITGLVAAVTALLRSGQNTTSIAQHAQLHAAEAARAARLGRRPGPGLP
jgi:hypothetical protein